MPIFVVGAPRSGTTLLGRILDQHGSIVTPGETHYFEDIWARRRELGRLEDPAELERAADLLMTALKRFHQRGQELVEAAVTRQALVERAIALGAGYGSLYIAFMGMLAESKEKTLYCDDTPRHIFHLRTIFDLFPDAKIIACVRDPRDFLSSYKNYWKVASERERMRALYHPVLTSLLWRSSANVVASWARRKEGESLGVVRYEDLVEHPEREVRRVCDLLGVE
jgi:hypothetical protein